MLQHLYDVFYLKIERPELLFEDDEEFLEYARSLNFEEFLNITSHRLDDMVSSCSFDQKAMNCKDEFVRIATRSGYCYTFNSRQAIQKRGDALYVHKAGKTSGLALSMNVEQYEYYFGGETKSASLEVTKWGSFRKRCLLGSLLLRPKCIAVSI